MGTLHNTSECVTWCSRNYIRRAWQFYGLHISFHNPTMSSILFVFTSATETLTGAQTVSALCHRLILLSDEPVLRSGLVPPRGGSPIPRPRAKAQHRLCRAEGPNPRSTNAAPRYAHSASTPHHKRCSRLPSDVQGRRKRRVPTGRRCDVEVGRREETLGPMWTPATTRPSSALEGMGLFSTLLLTASTRSSRLSSIALGRSPPPSATAPRKPSHLKSWLDPS